MEKRVNFMEKGAGAIRAMYGLGAYLASSTLEESLLNLVFFRVSQINGCAYCLDMHSKDLRSAGESEQRIYLVAAWRDTPLYSDRERAAFGFAEALTVLGREGISDEIYQEAARHFSPEELVALTMAVITINGYNRLNITFRPEVGDYKPGQFAVKAVA